MLECGSRKAQENPEIKAFVQLVDETTGGGILDFSELQSRPFIKFWSNLLIARYIEEVSDFKVVFFGTGMLRGYEKDYTNAMLADLGLKEHEEEIRQLHIDSLTKQQRIYSCGNFSWLKKDYTKWYHVKMPLKRGDILNETVTFVCYGN